MGMFDYVAFECKCPECGEIADDFQTKDGHRELKTLTPDKVDCFYTSCKNKDCNAWITVNVEGECFVKGYDIKAVKR